MKDKREIIAEIGDFYEYEIKDDNGRIRDSISDISTETVWDKDKGDLYIVITITTKRPGLIIGKAGRYFDALKKYLEKNVYPRIEIKLIENTFRFPSYPISWYDEQILEDFEPLDLLDEEKNYIIKDDIECGYGRRGGVALIFDECDITGKKCWCVSMDSSEGEYGNISVSMDYLNKRMRIEEII